MRKRLWILDLLLLGAILLSASMLRDRQEAAAIREQALLRRTTPIAPPPAVPTLPAVPPSAAASYLQVAQQFLFAKDRNPTIIYDPPPPPPPPKPMPALPLAYGMMNIGEPTVFLSEKPGAQHRGYRVGEKIGEFKIAAIDGQEITFDWEGKLVTKKMEEILDKKARDTAPAEAAAAKPATPSAVTTLAPVKAGPGVELSQSSRACVPGDSNPSGTVQDGYRKTVTKTPFGDSCRWEAVK